MTSKNQYLHQPAVIEFTSQLTRWLDGESFGAHQFTVRDKILPADYDREFYASTLEEAFQRFYWNGQYFDENQTLLDQYRLRLRDAMRAGDSAALVAVIDDALLWGSGGKVIKLYTFNRDWAVANSQQLLQKMGSSLAILQSPEPDTTAFDGDLRMNAGFTKVYALAGDNIMMYDGRIGAAMGFLARQFCESRRILLPEALCFPWAPGASTMNRNPSTDLLHFKQLANRSRFHAEWKIKAGWIACEALKKTTASWCSGANALRHLEAALFMLGYEIPLAHRKIGKQRPALSL
ncbi:hypothetical protein [Vogesella oryzae]|uniref:hypothetical protein n=1 Tax=Vogesella oryzae TaxID=1735285 RepID=UPI001582D2B5|nr:hypothetical protein [Vogesella oryzae]